MECVTNGKQLGLASRRYVGGCSRAYTPLGNGGFFIRSLIRTGCDMASLRRLRDYCAVEVSSLHALEKKRKMKSKNLKHISILERLQTEGVYNE